MRKRNSIRTLTEAVGCYVTKDVKEKLEQLVVSRVPECNGSKFNLSDLLREIIEEKLADAERKGLI